MDIEKVELLGNTKEQQANGMRPQFYVKTTDGNKVYVPIDEPANRHYLEVKNWYNNQETKPFDFDFPTPVEDEARGNFAPPVEVEPEELEEPETAAEPIPTEPQTLLPK